MPMYNELPISENRGYVIDASRGWGQIGDKIYICPFTTRSGKYCYDTKTNTMNKLVEKNAPEEWTVFGGGAVESAGDYIVFAPYKNHYFTVYNVKENSFSYIGLENKRLQYSKTIKYKEKIFFFADSTGNIMDTLVFEPSCNKIKKLYEHESDDDVFKLQVGGKGCVVNQFAYMPSNKEDTLFKIDLDDGKIELIELKCNNFIYTNIIFTGKEFVLTGEMEYIVRWDGGNQLIKISLEENNIKCRNLEGRKTPFSCCVLMDNVMFFAPITCQSIVVMDCESGNLSKVLDISEADTLSWFAGTMNNQVYMSFVSISGEPRGDFLFDKQGNITKFDVLKYMDFEGMTKERNKGSLDSFIHWLMKKGEVSL